MFWYVGVIRGESQTSRSDFAICMKSLLLILKSMIAFIKRATDDNDDDDYYHYYYYCCCCLFIKLITTKNKLFKKVHPWFIPNKLVKANSKYFPLKKKLIHLKSYWQIKTEYIYIYLL